MNHVGLCRATQDGRVMVESSDKMWSTGKRNGKPLQYSFLENPMNSMKRQKDRTLKDELPRSVDVQYATGNQRRNNSRKNEDQIRSDQSLSRVRHFATPWIAARQASLSITNSRSSLRRPSSQWCHPAISSSVVPFSSCSQSLPASESFPMKPGYLVLNSGPAVN